MRTPNRKRAVALALVTPLVLVGVTACNGDTPNQSASPAETTSAAPTTPAPSDEPTDETTEPADQPSPSEAADGDRVVAKPGRLFLAMQQAMVRAGSAHVSMDLGLGSADGVMSYANGVPEMAMTMDLSSLGNGVGKVEMRYVEQEFYMSLPPLTPEGKFFVLDPGNKTLGSLGGMMANLTPDATARVMSKSVKRMVDTGVEKVDGVDTTHYKVTVDTRKSLALLGNLPQGTAAQLPKTLDYDMWVDQDNLIRTIVVAGGAASTQIDYSDWGKPVSVKAPAAKDIVEGPANG